MIYYQNHSIIECKNIETGEVMYELSHWFTSDKHPETAGRVSVGYFTTYKKAEERHNEMLGMELLKDA